MGVLNDGTDGRTGQMGRETGRYTDRDGRTYRQTDGQAVSVTVRWTEEKIDRPVEGQTDGRTDGRTDGQSDINSLITSPPPKKKKSTILQCSFSNVSKILLMLNFKHFTDSCKCSFRKHQLI